MTDTGAQVRDLLAMVSGDLTSIAPQRMTEEQLVQAAWGFLHVEDPDLTIEQARDLMAGGTPERRQQEWHVWEGPSDE